MSNNPNDKPSISVPTVSQSTNQALERFAPIYHEEYESFKSDFINWLLQKGKKPFKREGYAPTTAKMTHYKVEKAFRWKWREVGEFTKEFTPEDAEAFTDMLVSQTALNDPEVRDHIKAIKRLFTWLNSVRGTGYDWTYSKIDQLEQQSASKRRHYFEQYEMSQLYDAAIEHGSMPSYHTVSGDERERLKVYLSQRIQKPKGEIGPDDFADANSWKFPSMIAMSIDLGLRPIEIERSNTKWLRLSDQKVVIPQSESSKSNDPWECVLSPRSVRALRRWLEEREDYEKYADTDALWLTKYANPYTTDSLNGLLNQLLELTDIKPRNRDLSWYSIRRGTGTMWTENSGLEQAKEQLRHKNLETTMRYTKANTEGRKEIAADNW